MPFRLFKKIFSFLNLLAVLALFIAYLSVYINPKLTVFPAFFGLAFPYLCLLNLLFMVLWMMYSPWRIIWSLGALLVGMGHVTSYVQIRNQPEPEEVESKVKVLSYNVRLFDLYNWTNNLDTRNKIFNLLEKENADILCFQEFFYAANKGEFETRDTLVDFLNVPFYHEGYTHKTSNDHYFGVVTFSKYPIVFRGEIPFDSDPNNFCIFTDIKIGKDTLRVYNAHLSSIRLQQEDYDLINKLGGKIVKGIGKAEGAIIKRIALAFEKRVEQANKILAHMETCRFKKIICADFNDSPMSYCYQQFSGVLSDSFKECGQGIGNTYIGIFPALRIDYIFHDSQIKSSNFRILPEELSDHLALTVNLNWKN